uniref:Uncharacterized protein n=1 Tax=Oryza punctata TaxID=4537 RepID=A0A0E0KQW9_ORYPU
MMDPEMMRVAQEQMSRMSPIILLRPCLRFATESIKNLIPDDIRRAGEQMNRTNTEDMLDMSRKLAGANPEELAAMKVQAEQRMSYVVSSAKAPKNQGNELFKLARHADAAAKYALAVDNLGSLPSREARSLQVVCGVNLMACHFKIGRLAECVEQGFEVLGYDPGNVKAYYRRGQAYKELGKMEAAVADLRRAHELSPEEDAIADALRDAEEKLEIPRGLVIEEIIEEEAEEEEGSEILPTTMGKMVTSVLQSMDPETISIIGKQFGMNLSRDDAANLQDAMKKLSPENLEKVMRWVNRARRAAEAARKAKEFLLGRRWLVLAIVMLILAFIVHQLGFIGG